MSKSKGNVLDPLDLIDGIELEALVEKRSSNMMQPEMAKKIEKSTRKHFPDGIPAFGTDALRFTFAALASTGRDIRFDLPRIEGYRNFCNKLWNASRYVLMQCENQDTGIDQSELEYSLADRWILSELQKTTHTVTEHIEKYRFDIAAKTLYEFTWHQYCDWYLELSKPILFSDATPEKAKRGTRKTLAVVLENLLRLLHPIMPFITEEIWQQVSPLTGKKAPSIMLQPYPISDSNKIDASAEADIEWLKTLVMGVRRIRSEMNIPPGKMVPLMLENWSEQDKSRFERNTTFISQLAKLEAIRWLGASDTAPEAATALAGEMKILIPLAGLIDKDAEIERLTKEITKLKANLEKTQARLNNPGFAGKAPAKVVEQAQLQAEEQTQAISALNEQLVKIEAL
jgi:valyl-tRNA synthetase